jgi:hypothetical protein
MNGPPHRYAYLHGFASSSLSRKGVYLREVFRGRGLELELPDLNVPTFEAMTFSAMLAALDARDAAAGGDPFLWRLIGSSMGGYLAARWAELRPDRVDRLVLLCPGLEMVARWPELVGEESFRRWEAEGRFEMEDGAGVARPLHWGFVEDAQTHPALPEPACPALILHGRRDDVVPVELSRRYAADRANVRLIELDDDHSLAGSLQVVAREATCFFEIPD